MASGEYTPRLVDSALETLFSELPALMLVGPRAVGKTTTPRRLVGSVARMDVPSQAAAFRFDADAALAAIPEPVLLDEWQEVPELMGAVRRAVDEDSRPGRFILTGSAKPRRGAHAWSGIGRVVNLRMYGLAVREILGDARGPGLLDRLALADLTEFSAPRQPPNLVDYVNFALRGGFPEAVLNLSDHTRGAWLNTYIERLVTNDVESQDGHYPDSVSLRSYFEALCVNTAGFADDKTIYDAAGISRDTARIYDALLSNLEILQTLPAWSNNRLSRLIKRPKRYIVDPSLVAAMLQLDGLSVLGDGDVLGRMIDTFVVSLIRSEAEFSPLRPRLYHLREKDGRREVDVLAEVTGGKVIAIEIKAAAAIDRSDARHLVWLRDRLGAKFLAGAVLHTGPQPFQLDERIFALPICALWT